MTTTASTAFAGLRRLAARAGLAAPLPAASEETETPPATPAPTPAPTPEPQDPPADPPAADPATDPAENDPPADPPAGDPAGDPPADPPATEAAVEPVGRSADFTAGRQWAEGRFAAVLLSPAAQANLEMATDLLASSDMEPEAIIGMCERYKGENSARRLLDLTPKINLGTSSQEQATGRKAELKAASAKVNKRTDRQAARAGVQVRGSRRAERAAK